MLLSTRDEGLPKQTHPVMSDFNYSIAKVEIEGKHYLLDATDKFMPFGMLPYRALNHYGRVMDYKNESYWFNIEPQIENQYLARVHLQFDEAGTKAKGVLDLHTLGYNAVSKHKDLARLSKEEYIDRMESSIEGDFKIVSHQVFEKRNSERKVSERFMFALCSRQKTYYRAIWSISIHFSWCFLMKTRFLTMSGTILSILDTEETINISYH